ncbi:MAG: hypothetical protein ABR987_13660 [Terracidiphilus sp.]|jgi:hypothetical protein
MIHSPQALIEIERAISRERLKRYLSASGSNLPLAVALYEQNVALSEAVFGLLHGLEVAIRNVMHDLLTAHYGTPRCFQSAALPLTPFGLDKVACAIRDAGGLYASPGMIVAEFTFAFWSNLAARCYHWTLWQPCLHRAFPAARLSRPIVHARLESVRTLRNRIAHHEPVLTSRRSLYAGSGVYLPLTSLYECAQWLGPELAAWLRSSFRYCNAEAILSQVASSGVTL